MLNSSVEGDQITYHGAEHLAIAVDTDRGLLVPVISDAGNLNMGGIARKIADLAARTRDNKVTPDELGGGTFTLTNTGSRGALFDTPIINQPQVAILGLGAVVKRPMVVRGEDGGESIAIRSMVYLALSYDRRVVDGADAARFLVTSKMPEGGAFSLTWVFGPMRVPQRIAIAYRLIGTALGRKAGRRAAPCATRLFAEVTWDPQTGYVDLGALVGVNAVIHLAGASVDGKRWTKKYKAEILNSRLFGTSTIARAVAELKPQVFISASAVGWYGESGNRAVIENDRVGDDFLATICREWEAAADLAGDIRTVKLRTGLVLDPTGGHLARCCPYFALAWWKTW